MANNDPVTFYTQRIEKLKEERKKQIRQRSRLAWFRLLSVTAGIFTAWLTWPMGWYVVVGATIVFIGIFIYFLKQDIDNNAAIENTDRLTGINETEIQVLSHHFSQLQDGSEFASTTHPYTHDLDIFGRASLYQYINRTRSEQGNAMLSGWLKEPAIAKTIKDRQEAARELSTITEWRQQLESYGQAGRITIATQQRINEWIAEPPLFIHKSIWQVMRILLPVTGTSLLIIFILGVIGWNEFIAAAILLMIVNFSISKKILPVHTRLNRVAAQLDTLSNSVDWIEGHDFKAVYLEQLKEHFAQSSGHASKKIRALTRILERLDFRLNFIVFIPLNTFFAWDLQQVFALEEWKAKNKQSINEWFNGVAEMEAISSLGTLGFNHPAWVFPQLRDEDAIIAGLAIGHPLIPETKRVNNSFSTSGTGQLNLVTGSNMGGKSTFLRSIGINMVLAMMGAPVCAEKFSLSPMKVMSTMRISDNLEESTSTFYAELKKLKNIIEAVDRHEKVFLLLDEILRGTNSADRHTGSKALIKQLIQRGGAGILATHDLELAQLANEFPSNIHNFHFDVQVANDELYFDYKLKTGICQSMNASILMKKIGIQM